jgi:hypothetical protein
MVLGHSSTQDVQLLVRYNVFLDVDGLNHTVFVHQLQGHLTDLLFSDHVRPYDQFLLRELQYIMLEIYCVCPLDCPLLEQSFVVTHFDFESFFINLIICRAILIGKKDILEKLP